MFAQHMLSVLRRGGMMATVMPHGVLFHGGEEQKIRKEFILKDHLEAVIGRWVNSACKGWSMYVSEWFW